MATTKIVLDDFSGGISEGVSPSDFSGRQWSQLKGFVLESEDELRSQWECQQVSSATNVKHIRGFTTGSSRFLVSLRTDGTLWYAVAPPRTASTATVNAVTWTQLTTGLNPSGGSVALNPSLKLRFLTEMQFLGSTGGYTTGLLLHTTDRTSTSPAILLYESSTGVLSARAYTDFYPTATMVNPITGLVDVDPDLNTFELGTGNVIPRANVGCMWGNFLVLGDVEWGTTFPLTSSNTKPYRNGLWISSTDYAGIPVPDRFLPQGGMNLIGTPDSVIRGLQVTDRGLLVFTTSATTGDGVILLRGTPPTGDGTVTYIPEVLRGGMGVPANTTGEHSVCHGQWPEAGAVTFVESKGTVWHTNGTDVGRLDTYGPTAPSVGQATDSVAAIGPFLFVSRGSGATSRLLVMRKFEQDGAWTELVTPEPTAQALCLTPIEDCLYFTQNGRVFRYAFAATARGTVAGSPATLTVSTAPQNLQGMEHDKKHWFRAGVRVTENSAGAVVVAVKSLPQSVLVSSSGFSTSLSMGLESRSEVVVRGHGPSVEAAVQVTVTGDVSVESVTMWVSGREPSR